MSSRTKTRSVSSATNSARNSTKSFTGSAVEQLFENGRRYCSESYYMPNDDEEQTRLAITHQAFLLLLDGQLTMSRVSHDLERILDIGTGTGEWAVAMAERFPEAEIIATDISVCQPTDVPPNLFFELDDAQEEWTYSEPFDLIHVRGLSGAFGDWPSIYAGACKHLRSGGYFEIADFGAISLSESIPDSYLSIFNGACQSAAEKAGTPSGLEHLRKTVLERAGLSVVKSKVFDVPLGTWSPDPRKKVLGKMTLISALEGLEAKSLRFLTRDLEWKEEDVRSLCDKVKEEIMRPGVRAFIPCQFVVARKVLG